MRFFLSRGVVSRSAGRGLDARPGPLSNALELARRVRSGICHINGATVHDEPPMPFGGVGDSGFGRFGSKAALEEFTELRWVTIQAGHRHYPI
jgi:benzaldehyde dehydrogenase (NAD)